LLPSWPQTQAQPQAACREVEGEALRGLSKVRVCQVQPCARVCNRHPTFSLASCALQASFGSTSPSTSAGWTLLCAGSRCAVSAALCVFRPLHCLTSPRHHHHHHTHTHTESTTPPSARL
jgi:hypothetical protein